MSDNPGVDEGLLGPMRGAVGRIETVLATTFAGMAQRVESSRVAMEGMNTAMEQFVLHVIDCKARFEPREHGAFLRVTASNGTRFHLSSLRLGLSSAERLAGEAPNATSLTARVGSESHHPSSTNSAAMESGPGSGGASAAVDADGLKGSSAGADGTDTGSDPKRKSAPVGSENPSAETGKAGDSGRPEANESLKYEEGDTEWLAASRVFDLEAGGRHTVCFEIGELIGDCGRSAAAAVAPWRFTIRVELPSIGTGALIGKDVPLHVGCLEAAPRITPAPTAITPDGLGKGRNCLVDPERFRRLLRIDPCDGVRVGDTFGVGASETSPSPVALVRVEGLGEGKEIGKWTVLVTACGGTAAAVQEGICADLEAESI